jgi:hypothetical protein
MSRSRTVSEILLGPMLDRPGEDYLVTAVSYDVGGTNVFSGTVDPRGYFLNVTPEGRHDRMRSFVLFSGIRVLILPAARFSQAKLDALQPNPELVKKIQHKVLTTLRNDLFKRLNENGGRGIEKAERIDALDRLLEQLA